MSPQYVAIDQYGDTCDTCAHLTIRCTGEYQGGLCTQAASALQVQGFASGQLHYFDDQACEHYTHNERQAP